MRVYNEVELHVDIYALYSASTTPTTCRSVCHTF